MLRLVRLQKPAAEALGTARSTSNLMQQLKRSLRRPRVAVIAGLGYRTGYRAGGGRGGRRDHFSLHVAVSHCALERSTILQRTARNC